MQERHLCWPSYFFLSPAVPPTFLFLELRQIAATDNKQLIFLGDPIYIFLTFRFFVLYPPLHCNYLQDLLKKALPCRWRKRNLLN